jgi:hypothetical protein
MNICACNTENIKTVTSMTIPIVCIAISLRSHAVITKIGHRLFPETIERPYSILGYSTIVYARFSFHILGNRHLICDVICSCNSTLSHFIILNPTAHVCHGTTHTPTSLVCRMLHLCLRIIGKLLK